MGWGTVHDVFSESLSHPYRRSHPKARARNWHASRGQDCDQEPVGKMRWPRRRVKWVGHSGQVQREPSERPRRRSGRALGCLGRGDGRQAQGPALRVGLEARKSRTFGRSRNPWRGGGDATQPGREPARPLASGQSRRAKGGLIPRRETPALCPGLAPTEGRKGQQAPCDRELRLLPL